MKKLFYALLPMALLWTACKKDLQEECSSTPEAKFISTGADADVMLPYRWISPYSVKTLRALRTAIATHPDEKVQSLLNGTLNSDNYRLYYKIEPHSDPQAAIFNSWVEADTNHIVFRYPLDSASMYPHIYTEEVIAERNDTSQTFYTTVPLNQPLTAGMNTIVLDTLYFPGSDETVLDFMLNLITANFSNDFINSMQTEMPELWQETQEFINNEFFVMPDPNGGLQPHLNGFSPLDLTNPDIPGFPHIERATREGDYQSDGNPGGPVRPVTIQRGITFTDNVTNINEPIRRLKVLGHRFGLPLFTAATDANGRFSTNVALMGPLTVSYHFINQELQIRSFNRSTNRTFMGLLLQELNNVLRINIPTEYSINVLSRNVNDLTINFGANTFYALCGLTFNAIQEANAYTISLGMRSNSSQTKFLDVLCWMKENNTGRSSAPMFKRMNVTQDPSYIFLSMGISPLGNTPLKGVLPDLLITDTRTMPPNLERRVLRETVFHEYGHSLHFFKVDNYYWNTNIQYSTQVLAANDYGNNITSLRGCFFALSEGWAEYIGQLYGSMKYTTARVRNVTISTDGNTTLYDETEPYLTHLENNPTFANSFIPKGLFHDLTDGGTNEWFDRIQGFSTNNIYQKLDATMTSIQLFRTRWETDHPNVNNNALFNEYLN